MTTMTENLQPEPSRKIGLIVLAFNSYVSISVGALLELVRFHCLSYLTVMRDFKTLPAISKFILHLPSTDYYAGGYIFTLLCLAPCLYVADRFFSKKYHVLEAGLMVAVGVGVFGAILSAIMAFPCFPRVTALPNSAASISPAALIIVVTLCILVAVTVFRAVCNSCLNQPSKKK